MYKYRNSADESPQRPASPRSRNLNSSIPRPNVSAERPMSGSYKGTQGASKDKTLSERYTNRTYNRLPSPKARFQTVVKAVSARQPFAEEHPSTMKDEQGRPIDKSQPPKPLPRSLVKKHSHSDIIGRRRPLDLECNRSNVQEEEGVNVRPKTSHCSRTDSRLEYKVLHTVKSVLSRALLQQGRIDETNLGHIIESMRDSLNFEDEESSEIDIELKPSRTTMNEVNVVEERSTERMSKPIAGIVRRDNPRTAPERKPYRKIYDQEDPFSNRNMSVGDEQEYVYVDIPDSVFHNFASAGKSDAKASPNARVTASKKSVQEDNTQRDDILKQHEVGDSRTKDNHFWNSSEDAKLREYIESLIHNMKTQVKGCDSRMTEVGGEIDSQGTLCRSFCVCKVCISKNNQPKLVLKPNPSEAEAPVTAQEEPKFVEASEQKPIVNEGKSPVQRAIPARDRLRLAKKPSVKSKEANPLCRVIKKTNPNFKPESSLNTSLDKKTSYTVVESGNVPEESDDLYLKRRIRKAPSRVTSKRLT